MRAPEPLVLILAAALASCRGSRNDYRHSNIIQTTHGYVQGQTENIQVNNGRRYTVDVFWGIPYARPPVGDLRFRRPLPADPWKGVLQANTPSNSCVQVPLEDLVPTPSPQPPFNEDCLYLNIWRPRRRNGEGKLATMMWIHGGGFTLGSSKEGVHNGSILASSEGVIVVSMNYRLGALGFMSLETEDAPGNMGLLDMTLALTWIRDNIDKFGGDPKSITVFGNSAGGLASSLFLVSPKTRDLFKNSIIQSGNPFLSVFHQTRDSASAAALELARRLNCSSDNKTALVQCLRRVEASDIATVHLSLTFNFTYVMTAVTDGYFLTQDPIVSFQTKDFKRCEILTGSIKDEGTYAMGRLRPDIYNFRSKEPLVNLSNQELTDALTQLLTWTFKPKFIPAIVVKIRELYNYKRLQEEEKNPSFSLLKSVTTDLVHQCPSRLLATFYSKANQNVYLYLLEHARDITTFPDWVGATHVSEVPFVFGTTTPDWPAFSRREVTLKYKIMNLWANFAKYGNPTEDFRDMDRWPTYSSPEPAKILVFTQSGEARVGRTQRARCDYWNSLPREYYRN